LTGDDLFRIFTKDHNRGGHSFERLFRKNTNEDTAMTEQLNGTWVGIRSARQLPVAVIGAGPVGLAAAAHLVEAGEPVIVLEAGAAVGASMLSWGHVRVFSPWRYNVDRAARRLLEASGWVAPDPEVYPTGREIVEQYMEPLANLPQLSPSIRLDSRVTAVTRAGFDKMKTDGRDAAPFLIRVERPDGSEESVLARAVIDASGTYELPNPLGTSGIPAAGERSAADRTYYGIPDVLGSERERYAGRRVLVIGSGHSAFNALLDLVTLSEQEPATTIAWAIRRARPGNMFGGGEDDMLVARGELGARIQALVQAGRLQLITGFRTQAVTRDDDGVSVSDGERMIGPYDEIIATTGFRPDLAMLGELRLSLDAAVESPTALAPLIDPNVHSCGTVRPHGAEELRHPETDFYIAGMKSYGRAPTFLMLTGYEQVRSIVAALQGDWESARRVELELPETGVCSASFADESSEAAVCCGPASVGGSKPAGDRVPALAGAASS
jgi:flavin-dependent dehydrogenase